jgi:Zn-finger nucleic acid-binding protein
MSVIHCPKCKQPALGELSELAERITAEWLPRACTNCGGFWVVKGTAQVLLESGVASELAARPWKPVEGDRRTGLCPLGHGIMTRAKVAWDDPYYLERCSRCGGVWLDAGEWQRLEREALLLNLDDIWEPAWRKRLMQDEERSQLRSDLLAKLGPDLFEELESVVEQLSSHPHSDVALAFLNDRLRAARKGSG